MLRKYVRQLKKPIQESYLDPLSKIQKLYEGDTTAAFDMEKVIVSAAGGPKFTSKLIPLAKEIQLNINNYTEEFQLEKSISSLV